MSDLDGDFPRHQMKPGEHIHVPAWAWDKVYSPDDHIADQRRALAVASSRFWRRTFARLFAGVAALILGAYGIPASAHFDSYPAVLIACTVYVVLMLYALGAIWNSK